jgi:flagellar hook-length control protein FliK
VRKITSGIQLNTSSVKEFRAESNKKTKNPEEDFAALLEAANSSAKSEDNDETEQKVDSEAKEGPEVKKKPGTKEKNDLSIPVTPQEVILQKRQDTDPAERANPGKQLTVQKGSKGSKGSSGKVELSDIKEMKPDSENAANPQSLPDMNSNTNVQSESSSLKKIAMNADSGTVVKAGEKKSADQKYAAETGNVKLESPGMESVVSPANIKEKSSNTEEKSDSILGMIGDTSSKNQANAVSAIKTEPADKPQSISLEANIKEKSSNTEEKSDSILAMTGDVSSKNKANEVSATKTESTPMDKMSWDRNLQIVTTEIAHKMEIMSDGDSTFIKVKLFPKGIGEVEISLSMGEGKLSGKILVENKEIRQMFTDRLNELNQSFKENNINAAKFEVGIGYGQGQSQGRQQGQSQVFYQNWNARYTDEIGQFDDLKAASKATVRGISVLA